MKIECPHCQQRYEVDEAYRGQFVECEGCGKGFESKQVVERLKNIAPGHSQADSSEAKKQCPMCGEEILAIAKKCKYCGERLEPHHPVLKFFTVFSFVVAVLFLFQLIIVSGITWSYEIFYPYTWGTFRHMPHAVISEFNNIYFDGVLYQVCSNIIKTTFIFMCVFVAVFCVLDYKLRSSNIFFMKFKTGAIFICCVAVLGSLIVSRQYLEIRNNKSYYENTMSWLDSVARQEGTYRFNELTARYKETILDYNELKEMENLALYLKT